jgi:hypothetical protein
VFSARPSVGVVGAPSCAGYQASASPNSPVPFAISRRTRS